MDNRRDMLTMLAVGDVAIARRRHSDARIAKVLGSNFVRVMTAGRG